MKRVFNSIFAITSLVVLFLSHPSYAGPYSVGTSANCGDLSVPVFMSPATTSSVLGPNDSGVFIPGMQLFTDWSSETVGKLVRRKSGECEKGGLWNGYGAYAVADTSTIVDTGREMSVDGMNFKIFATEHPQFGILAHLQNEYYKINASLGTYPVQIWRKDPCIFCGEESFSLDVGIRFRLVTLEPVAPGIYNFAARKVGDAYMINGSHVMNDILFSIPIGYNAFSVTLTGSTCSVHSGSEHQTVNLPDVAVSDIRAMGSTFGETDFNLSLDCPEGISLHATITDALDNDNRGNVLTNDPSASALGVGIQILGGLDMSLKNFGPPTSSKDTENQFAVQSGVGTVNVPFKARYVRDGAAIKPGTIQSQAIITFSYQ